LSFIVLLHASLITTCPHEKERKGKKRRTDYFDISKCPSKVHTWRALPTYGTKPLTA